MKKALTSILAGFIALAGLAQHKVKVTESSERIGEGKNNSLVVTIYEATQEEIEKEWKSLTKDYKAKVSSDNGQIFSDNAVIKSLGNNTIDIYARTEKVKDGESKLIVAFNLGGAYLNSSQHPEQFKEIKQIVTDFAIKTTKEAIAGQLKAEQKKLNNLMDDQQDLVKKNENLNKDIENNKAKIEELKEKIKKAEGDIVTNKNDQEKKKTEIETQKKVVEVIQAKEKAVQ